MEEKSREQEMSAREISLIRELNSPSIFICCSFLWVKTELPKAT